MLSEFAALEEVNILLDSMASEATALLKEELKDSLEAFSAFDRMCTDIMQLIRAVYKEFHHEGEYATKVREKEFTYWLQQLATTPRRLLFLRL